MQFDYVAFSCPEGYVFEGTKNTTHYALCYNWNYIYLFDLEVLCVRKCSLKLFLKQLQFIFAFQLLSVQIHQIFKKAQLWVKVT